MKKKIHFTEVFRGKFLLGSAWPGIDNAAEDRNYEKKPFSSVCLWTGRGRGGCMNTDDMKYQSNNKF